GANSICEKIYRDIPIITAFNVHKDEINRVGCERFAAEHNETLIHFYSEDICRPQVDNPSNESKGAKRQPWKKILLLNEMTDEVQHLLWTLNHSASDSHIPSKLSLCIGMPVMIRRNLATELCMTKGQEGIVYGWQTKRGTRNQMMLDVLFVKLINLPSARVINIDGLPENIVPVYSTSNTMIVTLPNGSALSIMREQVEVLPDFSMTDYASQGKTRPKNVVDVSNCKDYHGIYTALSRGATASGTIILQGFSPKKLTDGKNLDILQEFRELEILNEIIRLEYCGELHASVQGEYRHQLIRTYRDWKGKNYIPPQMPNEIKWTTKEPWIQKDIEEITWKIFQTSTLVQSQMSLASSQDSVVTMTNANGKHELDHNFDQDSPINNRAVKKAKTDNFHELSKGPAWHNNSCAYDSVLSVLLAIWSSNASQWAKIFKEEPTDLLRLLSDQFEMYHNLEVSLNDVRNTLQVQLENIDPVRFQQG
ncbi:hypothetical protein EV368DRAFT_1497, partial [Lentinula lateritia]